MVQEQTPAGRWRGATVRRLRSHLWHHKTSFRDPTWPYFGAPRSTQESRNPDLSTIPDALGRVLGGPGRSQACILTFWPLPGVYLNVLAVQQGSGTPFCAYLELLSSAPGGATTWPRSKARPGGGPRRPFHCLEVTFDTIKHRSVTQLRRILAHRGRPRSRGNFDLFTILDALGRVLCPQAAPRRVFQRSGRSHACI